MAGSHEISTAVFRFLLPKLIPNVARYAEQARPDGKAIVFLKWRGGPAANFSCRRPADAILVAAAPSLLKDSRSAHSELALRAAVQSIEITQPMPQPGVKWHSQQVPLQARIEGCYLLKLTSRRQHTLRRQHTPARPHPKSSIASGAYRHSPNHLNLPSLSRRTGEVCEVLVGDVREVTHLERIEWAATLDATAHGRSRDRPLT
jgi:hypothetical protein